MLESKPKKARLIGMVRTLVRRAAFGEPAS